MNRREFLKLIGIGAGGVSLFGMAKKEKLDMKIAEGTLFHDIDDNTLYFRKGDSWIKFRKGH
jgi:hypothetical protein